MRTDHLLYFHHQEYRFVPKILPSTLVLFSGCSARDASVEVQNRGRSSRKIRRRAQDGKAKAAKRGDQQRYFFTFEFAIPGIGNAFPNALTC